jgi:hypothetical protein
MNKNSFYNKKSNITINSIQLKNPIIKDFFFAYNQDSTLICDFEVSEKFACFFLSMKYHEIYPTYIEERLTKFEHSTHKRDQKFLFCLVDINDKNSDINSIQNLAQNKMLQTNLNIILHDFTNLNLIDYREELVVDKEASKIEKILTDLNMICLARNSGLVLCYSGYDIAQFIYSLSQSENSSFVEDKIKSMNLEEDIIESLCMIEKINKTDAGNLIKYFKDIRTVLTSSSQLLSLVKGMNNNKIKSIEEFIQYDFSNFTNNN